MATITGYIRNPSSRRWPRTMGKVNKLRNKVPFEIYSSAIKAYDEDQLIGVIYLNRTSVAFIDGNSTGIYMPNATTCSFFYNALQ